jgi:hypothetical protein
MTATFRSILEHAIGAEGVLSIRFASGEVRLRAVDGTAVRVRDRGNYDIADMFDVELADGSLSLHVEQGRRLFSGRRHTPDLEVDVPRRASVVIETASGDIAAEGLAGDQRYRTASGDVELRGSSGRLAVDVVSGDVDIVAAAEIDLSARTVSGDLEVRAGRLPRLRASTTSGDMKVAGRFAGDGPYTIETVSGDALIAPVGDVQIEMTTVTGDLRSDVAGRPEGGRGHRRLSIGKGGPLMTFRSLSGDLRVTRSVVMMPSEPPAMPLVTARSAEPADAGPEAASGEPAAGATSEAPAAPDQTPRPVTPDPAPTERSATRPWAWAASSESGPDEAPTAPGEPAPASESISAAEAPTTSGEPAPASEAISAADAPTASGEPAPADEPVDQGSPAAAQADDPRMDILRALERGDIDVAEAGARLEAIGA